MTAQEKMAEIKKNVGSVKDPEIIFAMNQLYRELERDEKTK